MDAEDRTDAELLDAIRSAGDAGALEALLTRHTGRVRNIVYPLVLNDADADDVTQEAMLRALRGLDSFRAQSSFATWLYRVAVNAAKDFLRSRNRRGRRFAEECETEESADLPFRTPAREAESAELDAAIGAALAQLPDDQRIALSLVVLQGLPERDAAQVAGCAHATLRWRVFRARRRLRETLAGAGVGALALPAVKLAEEPEG